MKKRLTGILAFIVSMTMAASMLTACGGAKKDDSNNGSTAATEQKEKSPEEQAKDTLDSLMAALKKYDLKEAAKYATNTDFINELDGGITNGIKEGIGEMGEMFPEDMLEKMIDTVLVSFCNGISYDNVEVEMNDDKTKATIEFSMYVPEIDDTAFDGEKMQKYFSDSLGFDMNDSMAMMNEYASRKGKSVEELSAEFSNGDMETLLKDVFSTFQDEFIDAIDNAVVDAVKDAGTNETQCTAVVEKQEDGSWKITSID